jgi:glycine C-acetyltransferase/8-amino-7-oxononanoate synthase
MARYLTGAARTLLFSSALPPPAAAGALAALDLLESRPQLVDRLAENGAALRDQLELEGLDVVPARTQIAFVVLGDPALAVKMSDAALARGVFTHASTPPVVAPAESGVRLTVMASHRPGELRAAARVLAAAVRDLGFAPAAAGGRIGESEPATGGVFDFEARAA